MIRTDYKKLMADMYDDNNFLEEDDFEYYLKQAKNAKGPILELGCGTGRLLIPILEKGLDICGLDSSPDMLEKCRLKCKKNNLQPKLYEQSMVNFKLPDKFGLIILIDAGLSIFVNNEDIQKLFSCVYSHLNLGGSFIFEAFEITANERERKDNNNQWTGGWSQISDDTLITWRKLEKWNEKTYSWECPCIYDKFVNGNYVETELNVRQGRYFSIEEVTTMLTEAGFKDINALNWQRNAPAIPNATGRVTFSCKLKINA